MPKRPRQHQLESESRAAIRSAIPSRWVYRDLDQDYGIDSEIEIFDKDDNATGAKFLVQLKATDKQDLTKALTIWLSLSKGEYFSSLDIPVLIVRYHAPSNRLFVRWFHSLNPYIGKRSARGVSFQLTDVDAWTDSTAITLEMEVNAYRKLRSPHLTRPIEFEIAVKHDAIHGVPSYEVASSLRQSVNNISHLISLTDKKSCPHKIQIDKDHIVIYLAGSTGFTLNTTKGYTEETAHNSLHHDILVGIGLALYRFGHSFEGAEILGPSLEKSRLARDIRMAVPIARCLARANKLHRALEISEQFFVDNETIDAAQVLMMPFLSNRNSLSVSERDFVVRILSRIANKVEQNGRNIHASLIHYNVANLLRTARRYREAIRSYRKAARSNDAYLKRYYFWRELAGILFECHRFTLSAEFYRRALALTDNSDIKFLYADALLFSGEYEAAENLFNELLDSVSPELQDAEWVLKCSSLSWLRDQTRFNKQKRRNPQIANDFNPINLPDEEVERICRLALESDALCALAWFNLGGVYLRREDLESATNCFLFSALIVPWDLESWSNVVGLTINTKNVALFGWSLCAAFTWNGETFLRELAERFPEDTRAVMVSKIADILKQIPPERGGREFVIRVHNANLGWTEQAGSAWSKI